MKVLSVDLSINANVNNIEEDINIPHNICFGDKSISTKGICLNFISKRYIKILELYARAKQFYEYKKLTLDSGEELDYIQIYSIPETKELFEIFKTLGAVQTNIQLAVNWKLKKLYLSPNLYSLIYKYVGGSAFNAILLYLVSLAYSIVNLKKLPSLIYDDFKNTISIDGETDTSKVFTNTDIGNYVYILDKDVFSVTDCNFQNIAKIEIIESPSLYAKDIRIPKFGNYTFLKVIDKKDTNGSFKIDLLYYSSLDKNTSSIYRYSMDKIETNELMNIMTIATYSSEMMLTGYSLNRTIVYNPKINEAYKNNEVELISTEDVFEIPALSEGFKTIGTALKNLFEFAEIPELLDSKALSALLDIEIKKTVDSFDADSLKEQYANDTYAQELYKNVKSYYDDFDLKDFKPMLKALASGDLYSMLFYGEAGSGKSTAARVLFFKIGLPYVSVNFSTNIEESDFIGTLIENPNKKSELDPEFVWKDGILTRAIRNGYGFIAEEIGFARPGILGKLNSLLDEARQIELPTGEIVKAHKNFKIVCTTNIAYEGTNRLNEAFRNRFEICKEFKMPDRKDIKSIIISRLNYTNNSNIENILNVFYSIIKYSNENNLSLIVSMRQLLNIFKLGKYYKSAEEAIKEIMIDSAFIQDPEYKEDYLSTILKAFDLSFKI